MAGSLVPFVVGGVLLVALTASAAVVLGLLDTYKSKINELMNDNVTLDLQVKMLKLALGAPEEEEDAMKAMNPSQGLGNAVGQNLQYGPNSMSSGQWASGPAIHNITGALVPMPPRALRSFMQGMMVVCPDGRNRGLEGGVYDAHANLYTFKDGFVMSYSELTDLCLGFSNQQYVSPTWMKNNGRI